MSLPVILSPEAEEDAEHTCEQLEQQRPGSGTRFLVRLRELLERLESLPELYAPIWQQVRAAQSVCGVLPRAARSGRGTGSDARCA